MNRVIKEVASLFLRTTLFAVHLLWLPYPSLAYTGEKRIIEADAAKSNGALKVKDLFASGNYSVSLAKTGEVITFNNLPAASKLAIRYASVKVGTITIIVTKHTPVKEKNRLKMKQFNRQ